MGQNLTIQTGIKSIQRGITNFIFPGSSAITITPVNPSKTELRHLGATSAGNFFGATLTLTNSTTITASCDASGGQNLKVSWELTEFY
jgi:hypothetical protein